LDPLLRGLCEQHIDVKILESDVQEMTDVVKILELPVSSNDDALIGIFLGMMYDILDTQCKKVYDRYPNPEEISGFYNILSRRAHEFKALLNNPLIRSRARVEEEQLDDIEIEWNPIKKRKSYRSIFHIPIPT
jgi:hypothetical protein